MTASRRRPDPIPGAYPAFTHSACRSCGQLCRIEVCYPLVNSTQVSTARFCPMCGGRLLGFENRTPVDANGSDFYLVAAAFFNREKPTQEDVEIVKSIYPMWNPHEEPSFRAFIKSLVPQ